MSKPAASIRRALPLAAACAALAALSGCQLLLPARMLCYPAPLADCLARHQPPAVPVETPRDKN